MASLLSLRLKAWTRSFAPGVMSCIADSGFNQLLGEQTQGSTSYLVSSPFSPGTGQLKTSRQSSPCKRTADEAGSGTAWGAWVQVICQERPRVGSTLGQEQALPS